MLLKKLHASYLFVENVKKSSLWYSKVLNTQLEIDEDNFGLIRIGDQELCFHQADSKSPASSGGCVGYWNVENLLAAANKFIEHGGIVYRGPIEIPESDEGICQIKDPFGNVIGLQGRCKK